MATKEWLISVIILNYRTPKLTVNCINSILQLTQWINFEVILVDNWSWSDSRDYFDQYMPDDERVKLIYSPNNLGFGWGNNLWYTNSRGEYLFFLNSDTLLFEDSITKLYEEYCVLSRHMKLGILGPRLYLDYDKTRPQFTWTQQVSIIDVAIASFPYLRKIFIRKYQKFTLSQWDRNSNKELGAVCGAAFLVEKDIWNQIWWFDDRFFLYMEEFDLAMRIQLHWYVIFYTTITSIIHLENQSPKITWRKFLFSFESLCKFIYKYLFYSHK